MNQWEDDIQAADLPGLLRNVAEHRSLTASQANACEMAAEELERNAKEYAQGKGVMVFAVAAATFLLAAQFIMAFTLWQLTAQDNRAIRLELSLDPMPWQVKAQAKKIHRPQAERQP